MKKLFTSVVSFTALSILAMGTYGATIFTDTLSTGSLGPNLELADTDGFGANGTTDNSLSFSGSGVSFSTAGGNDSRNYIRTTDTDYGSGYYAAEVTWNGADRAFVGFGGGNVGTFGTPDWDIADSLWIEVLGTGTPGVQGMNTGRFTTAADTFSGDVVAGAPVRFRIEFNSAANTIQFLADNNYSGAFSADVSTSAFDISTIGGGANFFTEPGDENRFFFGGESGAWSDFATSTVVIPEPSTFALLAFAAVSLSFLRRRRK
jgi:hypothetical protein